MQLSTIRERISRLPRFIKILLPILLVLLLVIIAEGFYYLWTLREKAKDSMYIDTSVIYQEGVFSYDRATKEPIAIRGWVTKIDGWFLTVQNEGQETIVEINRDFGFTVITEEPKKLSQKNFEEAMSKKSPEEPITSLAEEGFLAILERPKIGDLSQIIKAGNFVVISSLESEETGAIKGNFLSVLEFLDK